MVRILPVVTIPTKVWIAHVAGVDSIIPEVQGATMMSILSTIPIPVILRVLQVLLTLGNVA